MVLYINFQLLENKWRNSRSQNDVSDWRRHWQVPPEQNSWLHYRLIETGPFVPPSLND